MTGKQLETVTATGRAHWAAYLINGDCSGLEPADVAEADAFVRYLGGLPVDCGEESFFGRPEGIGHALPGDCLDYAALILPD